MIKVGGKIVTGQRYDGAAKPPSKDALLSGAGWSVHPDSDGDFVLRFIKGEQGGGEISIPLTEDDVASLQAGDTDVQTLMAKGRGAVK